MPCIYKCWPYDLVYDPNTKSCVKEDQAPPGTCFTTSTKPPVSTTPMTDPTDPITTPTIPTDPTTIPTEPTTTTTTTPKTTSEPGPEADCEYDGQKLPFPGDCHKYYRCSMIADNSY